MRYHATLSTGVADLAGNPLAVLKRWSFATAPVVAGPCDNGLAIYSLTADAAAAAMGICEGLNTAEWVLPDGSAGLDTAAYKLGHGILSGFGSNVHPQEGSVLLALSTGPASAPMSMPGYVKGYDSAAPAGFPVNRNTCLAPRGAGKDGIALKVTLQVPVWAKGYSFNWKYYSQDFPDYTCDKFSDQAIVRVEPAPTGYANGNIVLSPDGYPAGADSPELMQFCENDPDLATYCSLGMSDLQGTGFENGAGSGWMNATATAHGGDTITLYFTIWDSEDGFGDSTILFDNWHWIY
jgi:hypothetical protein